MLLVIFSVLCEIKVRCSVRYFTYILLLLNAMHLAGCGLIKGQNNTILNDPVPNGTVVAQGSFFGQNGMSVTGTARVYRMTADNTYVIRLEGISTPSESGLILLASSNGNSDFQANLRGTSGNQNYFTGSNSDRYWTEVRIESTRNTSTPIYGSALLSSVP